MDKQQNMINYTLKTLTEASSKLNALLRQNKPKLSIQQYTTIKEAEKNINKAITTLQYSGSTD